MTDSRALTRPRRIPFNLSAPANDRLALNIVYALYAASLIFQIPSMLGVILAYLKREDVEGTYLWSHTRWQIRTFWLWLFMMLIGWASVIVLFGFLIIGLAQIWLIYRILKGWLALSDGRPINQPGRFF